MGRGPSSRQGDLTSNLGSFPIARKAGMQRLASALAVVGLGGGGGAVARNSRPLFTSANATTDVLPTPPARKVRV